MSRRINHDKRNARSRVHTHPPVVGGSHADVGMAWEMGLLNGREEGLVEGRAIGRAEGVAAAVEATFDETLGLVRRVLTDLQVNRPQPFIADIRARVLGELPAQPVAPTHGPGHHRGRGSEGTRPETTRSEATRSTTGRPGGRAAG